MDLNDQDREAIERVSALLASADSEKDSRRALIDALRGSRASRMKAIVKRDQALAELREVRPLIEHVATGGELPPEPFATGLMRALCAWAAGDMAFQDGDDAHPEVDVDVDAEGGGN